MFALIVAFFSFYYARKAQNYGVRQYVAERREDTLALLTALISHIRQLEADFSDLLQRTDYKLTNDEAIRIAKLKEQSEKNRAELEEILTLLQSDSILTRTDPAWWLKVKRKITEVQAHADAASKHLDGLRNALGLDARKE
jgi:YesN/AraC family two-component response regulator